MQQVDGREAPGELFCRVEGGFFLVVETDGAKNFLGKMHPLSS